MLGKKNIKCPKRKKPTPYDVLRAREGKCRSCDCVIADSLSGFL